MSSSDFLNTRVLLTLAMLNQREAYVYEMAQRIKLGTAGILKPTTSRMYPDLAEMERLGWVQRENREQSGHLVAYYSLTEYGKGAYQLLLAEWREQIRAIERFLASLDG